MRRADRLFQIIQYLRSRRITTAAWLAEHLEVSERTIYRDIADLIATGVQIEGEAGVGYIIRPEYNLPPLMFTREELEALSLGLRFVTSSTDVEMARAADRAKSKLLSVLPATLGQSFHDMPILVPSVSVEEDHTSVYMGIIRNAINTKTVLSIHYTDEAGSFTERDIRPLGLFYWHANWVLAGWCELRQHFRHFRLDRLLMVMSSQKSFIDEPGKRLSDLIASEKIKAKVS